MPNPKPLKKDYKVMKETKKLSKLTIRSLLDYACNGNPKFVDTLKNTPWNTLPNDDVMSVILLTLSYGLMTHEKEYKAYILQQKTKGDSSLFQSMLNYNKEHLKKALENIAFFNIFKLIFSSADLASKVLFDIRKRVSNMRPDEAPTPQDKNLLEALIGTLIEGKSIAIEE